MVVLTTVHVEYGEECKRGSDTYDCDADDDERDDHEGVIVVRMMVAMVHGEVITGTLPYTCLST